MPKVFDMLVRVTRSEREYGGTDWLDPVDAQVVHTVLRPADPLDQGPDRSLHLSIHLRGAEYGEQFQLGQKFLLTLVPVS